MNNIAIAITTHNRPEVFAQCYATLTKYLPKGANLYVVDDGSDIPVPQATYRFGKPQGIAIAKNKCFELCQNVEHIFLLDDDCWPTQKNWHLPYINSGLNHLCFTFTEHQNGGDTGHQLLKTENGINYYSTPCGCLMYYRRICLQTVGGMDTDFRKWAYEHVQLSDRIHNAGLTPHPFMDVAGSEKLFRSLDYEQSVIRSVPPNDRANLAAINERIYQSKRNSAEYIEFRQPGKYMITCAFTSLVDPQRGTRPAEINTVKWQESIAHQCSAEAVVLCDPELPQHTNPYFARWFAYRDYVASLPAHSFVWLTDGTDVEMLRDPFTYMKAGILYVGDEAGQTLNHHWLRTYHYHDFYNGMFDTTFPLLNAGICGGKRDVVLEFCNLMCERSGLGGQLTDMAMFNYTAYIDFRGRFEHGAHINTTFKAYEDNGFAYFKHK